MKNLLFKKIRPTTPSQRALKVLKKPKLWTKKPIKHKTLSLQKRAGRNQTGQITVFQKGGGHKKIYREVDFTRINTTGIVEAIEYDPYRTAYLARLYDNSKREHSYILAPKNLCVGSLIKSGKEAEIKLGHAMPLHKIPVGSLLHNLSTSERKRGQYCRAAGTYAQLIQKTKNYARVRLSSGEQRLIQLNSYATLGVVSNENNNLNSIGKAGRNRWIGKRPNVRGVAMNPIDHPHGGGEGKTSGGRPSVTPWGKPTKGSKTSRSRNSLIVVSRRKN
ncbi:50S ribosomal protein L2 (mitochondrion) [Nannochloropsis oceanica]|uniref:Large ribosomal subunit protein uL2m n=1 Tax=Nannochloropsis oceanica TaxID=145522 RepID=T1R812_9STRA|nr:50S ribosomal protein L2 [Nannochloropsis oceanica]AHX24954.1 50S ribosomal protein L2 [Nannochloropsis oceanica]